MKTVYKYPVPVADAVRLNMPVGAKILTVQSQNDTPTLWALVDPDAPLESRVFRVIGTGHPVEDGDLTYIGTAQQFGGSLVWHIFELSQPT